MRGILLCLSLLLASSSATSVLETELQRLVDELATSHKRVLQVAYKSATEDLSVAAGTVNLSSTISRPATTDDRFLFGSGTKAFTAASVLRLVDRGIVKLDDPLAKHLDPLFASCCNTSLAALFGAANASKVTVDHVLTMRSGIQDFDWPVFDTKLLLGEPDGAHVSPLDFISYAAKNISSTEPFICEPGTCVCYSSTSFVLAGCILLAHAPPHHDKGGTWWDFHEASFLPASLTGNRAALFPADGPLRDALTVPGESVAAGWPSRNESKNTVTKVMSQSSSILGMGCCNLAATTTAVAHFFYDLLGGGREGSTLVSPELYDFMMDFRPLSKGWAVGYLDYGGGLMISSVKGQNWTGAADPHAWGSYWGHAGDVFGFQSENGFFYGLNASISVVTDTDDEGTFLTYTAACKVVEVAAYVTQGKKIDLECA
eukprot:g6245.t1